MLGDAKGALRDRLEEERLERFIGVIYRPDAELQSHYTKVEPPGQFGAYVWFERTGAVQPLTARTVPGTETWPFGA
jgi:erythromycin esterase-like protein